MTETLNIILKGDVESQEWFIALVDECQAIITETEFTARWALIEGYHLLGVRLLEAHDNFERAGIYGREIASRVSQSLGKSRRTVERAVQFARQYPDLAELPGGKAVSWRQICNELLPAEHSPGETPPLPDGRFRCVVIDPPWPMQKIEREVRPNQGTVLDYPVMSLEEIEALTIPGLADPEGCHVYLWVTHKFLPDGLRLLEAWGVRYQCTMTWVKNVGITPFSWMYDTEHVLFGRIGSLDLDRLGLRLSFSAPVTVHSAKPDMFYERVVEASPGPRLAMFERKERPGFVVWGNEVPAVV